MAIGGKVFSDWTLIDLQLTGGGVANFEQIDVSPLANNGVHTGLRYFAPSGAFGTSSNHPDSAAARLIYSFNVQATGTSPPIQESAAVIKGYNFFAREGARIRIIETVETPAGGDLAEIIPFVRPSFAPDDPSLFQSATFLPRSMLHIVTRIDIEGPLINDLAQLTVFEQRFGPVPEPSSLALAGFLTLAGGVRHVRGRRCWNITRR
jgi:hypothetical protein